MKKIIASSILSMAGALLGLSLLLATPQLSSVSRAQSSVDTRVTSDYHGRDFWLAFPQNARAENTAGMSLAVLITGEPGIEGYVTVMGHETKFAIGEDRAAKIELDSNLNIMETDATPKGVHVIAERNVSCFGISQRKASTDSYAAIPTPSLGTDYWVIGYNPLTAGDAKFATAFAVVATADNTMVVVDVKGTTPGQSQKDRLTLKKGEVFQLHTSNVTKDLTGAHVTSNKPVAFFTGHVCAQVPDNVSFCDILLEMEPPSSNFGREFVVVPFAPQHRSSVRIVATMDNTQVLRDGKLIATINAGEFYNDDNIEEPATYNTTSPVVAAQYAHGSEDDEVKVGDPFMVLLTPTTNFVRNADLLTLKVSNTIFQPRIAELPHVKLPTVVSEDPLVKYKREQKTRNSADLAAYLKAGGTRAKWKKNHAIEHEENYGVKSGKKDANGKIRRAAVPTEHSENRMLVSVPDPDNSTRMPSKDFDPRLPADISEGWGDYLTVIAEGEAPGRIYVDGQEVPLKPTKGEKFVYAQVPVQRGPHAITGEKPFGAYLYGFGAGVDNYDSYGHPVNALIKIH